ncbi:MAG: DNA-3-methyladenine glycosylase [Candidatus Paceibacterota bacterium]
MSQPYQKKNQKRKQNKTSSVVLSKAFFNRDARTVATELLGKYLVRKKDREYRAECITEVEIYDGPEDRASHAFRGVTNRNRVMFGPAGYWYVYLCYGIHQMLNVVVRETGYPAAILIRGTEHTPGPGRVGKCFFITKDMYEKPVGESSGLWIEDRGVIVPKKNITRAERIGVSYAGKKWAGKKYRFIARNVLHTKE